MTSRSKRGQRVRNKVLMTVVQSPPRGLDVHEVTKLTGCKFSSVAPILTRFYKQGLVSRSGTYKSFRYHPPIVAPNETAPRAGSAPAAVNGATVPLPSAMLRRLAIISTFLDSVIDSVGAYGDAARIDAANSIAERVRKRKEKERRVARPVKRHRSRAAA